MKEKRSLRDEVECANFTLSICYRQRCFAKSFQKIYLAEIKVDLYRRLQCLNIVDNKWERNKYRSDGKCAENDGDKRNRL